MIAVRDVRLAVLPMRTRLPFRYGIASMTALPHLIVQADCLIDGRRQAGIAADGLAPKWFTKNPSTSYADDLRDMLAVIQSAADLARQIGNVPTVFDLWQALDAAQRRWAAGHGYPPLLWGLGVSLLERAVIDAFCRATGRTLADAVRANTLGIRLAEVHSELAGLQPADVLPPAPLRAITIRHTVGLSDPLSDADIPPAERLDDGLPQSLEASIRAYGLTHFKIKLSGDEVRDRDRLHRLARLLVAGCPQGYAFSLDGNEQYADVAAFARFQQLLTADGALAPFLRRLLFVEQPLPRDRALDAATGEALRAWPERPPVIIDESDGEAASLPLALARGYAGASHKNCKGVIRGIANAALLVNRRRADPAGRYLQTGEDLATVGPVSLLQDLAVMATLAIADVERNGHHYFRGLSMFPPDVQQATLDRHGDFYRRHERGFPTPAIHHGQVAVGSVVDAPFGVAFLPDLDQFTPLEGWDVASLERAAD